MTTDNAAVANLLARQEINDCLLRYCWGIVHRTVVYDFERFDQHGAGPVGHPAAKFFDSVIRGTRGRGDYSYQILNP